MAALPYMPLYVADYLADAAHLTTIEHGAYLLLIMNYWQRGEALPADDARLARIARVSPKVWAEMKPTMAEFFEEMDSVWVHHRIEKELKSVREKSEKARLAGIASAEQRRISSSTSVQRPLDSRSTRKEQTFNHTDTDTDSDNKTLVQKAAKPPRGGGEIDLDFDEFWKLYPRRDAKKAAVRAYAKARRVINKDELHRLTVAYAKSREGKDPTYTPMAQKWLNEERWNDMNINPQPTAAKDKGRYVRPPLDYTEKVLSQFAKVFPGPAHPALALGTFNLALTVSPPEKVLEKAKLYAKAVEENPTIRIPRVDRWLMDNFLTKGCEGLDNDFEIEHVLNSPFAESGSQEWRA